MEGQDGGVNAEDRVPTQHFHIPVLEIERPMWSHGSGVGGKLLVRSICDRRVGGRLFIGDIGGCEVGESGNADRWRVSDGGDRRCRNRIRLWDGDWFKGWRLRDLRFDVSAGKPERCDDGSCSGVFLVRASGFWLPDREYGWGRESLPATLS